jgi:hypothetical protein
MEAEAEVRRKSLRFMLGEENHSSRSQSNEKIKPARNRLAVGSLLSLEDLHSLSNVSLLNGTKVKARQVVINDFQVDTRSSNRPFPQQKGVRLNRTFHHFEPFVPGRELRIQPHP